MAVAALFSVTGHCGYMPPRSEERRRRPRIATMILCEIRIGEQPAELVRVRDMNECGVKIATRKPLLVGDRVRVRMTGTTDWCLARVVWGTSGVAGLAFSRAIDLPPAADARGRPDARRPVRHFAG